MSVSQSVESFLHHQYWIKDGDSMPWLKSTKYDGKITVQQALPSSLDDASVEAIADANKVIIKPKNGVASLEIRFRSDGNENDQNIVALLAAVGVDHYRLIDTLTVDQGAQVFSGSIKFGDQIAGAAQWITPTSRVTPTDSIGSYVLNTHAYDRFLLVASTLATTTLYIDWR